MTHQTHIERLAAKRAQGRTPPRIEDADDTDTTGAPRGDETGGPWTIGSVVAGRFVLQQRLGRGRYGPVFKAQDRSLSEALIGVEHHVALQELHPRIATQASVIERLEDLPLQPQSWSHPNIAKILEFGRDGTKFFLCEELLEGVSLRLVLEQDAREALTADEIQGVLRAVGDALNYAHAKGVVHGDLRPENVFVTEAYKVKLLSLMPSTEPRPAPVYVEDPGTGNQPHPSDDVYGLACLAYEMITGRHPYNGNSPLEALRAGLTPHPAPGLPPLRWQALARGLALRREQRTASVSELLAGLGVTGMETLRPTPPDFEPPATRARAQAADVTPWPTISDSYVSELEPQAAPQAAVFDTPAARPRNAPAGVYASTAARRERPQPAPRRSSPVRASLFAALAVALALLVYLDYARLRMRAGDVFETGAAFVATEVALWRQQRSAPAPSAPPRSTDTPSAAAQAGAREPQAAAHDAPATPEPEGAAPPQVVAAAPPPVVVAASPAADAAPITNEPAVTARDGDEAQRARGSLPPAPLTSTTAAAAPPRFGFAERTVTVNESDVSARIVIRRTGAANAEASVVWWTSDRTASSDEDFAVLGARIEKFAAGEDYRVIHVPLIADSKPEQTESFVVNLRAERAGAGSTALAEVVVRDDDR